MNSRPLLHFVRPLLALVAATCASLADELPATPAAKAALLASQAPKPKSAAACEVFHADKLAAIDAAVEAAIHDEKIIGASLWVERNGVAYHKAFGQRALAPTSEPMTEDTIFDLASITKVVATAEPLPVRTTPMFPAKLVPSTVPTSRVYHLPAPRTVAPLSVQFALVVGARGWVEVDEVGGKLLPHRAVDEPEAHGSEDGDARSAPALQSAPARSARSSRSRCR